MGKRIISVSGVKFDTFSDACKSHNVPEGRVRQRLKAGWTTDQAFELSPPPLSFTVNCKVFRSIASAAKAFGVDEDTARARHRAGWSPEQVVGVAPPPADVRLKAVTVREEQFPSFAEAARHFGVEATVARGRIKIGWSIEEAFNVVLRPGAKATPKPIKVGTKTYGSISELAKAHGLKPSTLMRRLRTGAKIDDALRDVENSKGKEVCVEGVKYSSVGMAAKNHGLSEGKVRGRLNRDWTVRQSFELDAPPLPKKSEHYKAITVGEMTFESTADAARFHDIPVGSYTRGRDPRVCA